MGMYVTQKQISRYIDQLLENVAVIGMAHSNYMGLGQRTVHNGPSQGQGPGPLFPIVPVPFPVNISAYKNAFQ